MNHFRLISVLLIISIFVLIEILGEASDSVLLEARSNNTGEELDLEYIELGENKSFPFIESYDGTEVTNLNNWLFLNHDIFGTRASNQSIINKQNVNTLELKWRLLNNFEFQGPPILVNDAGYVQDYGGNVIAFNGSIGKIIWKSNVGGGPTMGLAFDRGLIFASTATNATVVALN